MINLSSADVFRYYSKKYGITGTNYSFGLFGLELRKLRIQDAESVYNNFTASGENVYKYKRSDEGKKTGYYADAKAHTKTAHNDALRLTIDFPTYDYQCYVDPASLEEDMTPPPSSRPYNYIFYRDDTP